MAATLGTRGGTDNVRVTSLVEVQRRAGERPDTSFWESDPDRPRPRSHVRLAETMKRYKYPLLGLIAGGLLSVPVSLLFVR